MGDICIALIKHPFHEGLFRYKRNCNEVLYESSFWRKNSKTIAIILGASSFIAEKDIEILCF